MYEEAQRIGIDDWEIWHNKGLCNMYLKQYEGAADCFKRANAIQRHDATYMQLGKVFTLQEEYKTAIEARAAPRHTTPHRQPAPPPARTASPATRTQPPTCSGLGAHSRRLCVSPCHSEQRSAPRGARVTLHPLVSPHLLTSPPHHTSPAPPATLGLLRGARVLA